MANTSYVVAMDLAVLSTQSIHINGISVSVMDHLAALSPVSFPFPWTHVGGKLLEPLLAFLDDVLDDPPRGMEILVTYPSTWGLFDDMNRVVAALEPPLTRFHPLRRHPGQTMEEAYAVDMDDALLRQQEVLAPYGAVGTRLLFPGWEWFTRDEVRRMLDCFKAHADDEACNPNGVLDPDIWTTIAAYTGSYDLLAFVATL